MISLVLGFVVMVLISSFCMVYTMYWKVTCKHSTIAFFVSAVSTFAHAFVFGLVEIIMYYLLRSSFEDAFITYVVAALISAVLATISYMIARKIISPLDILIEAGRVTNNKQ